MDAGTALNKGLHQLEDGNAAFRDGIAELAEDGGWKLRRLTRELDAMHAADLAYTNFGGIADGRSGSVRFIIETDAIEKTGEITAGGRRVRQKKTPSDAASERAHQRVFFKITGDENRNCRFNPAAGPRPPGDIRGRNRRGSTSPAPLRCCPPDRRRSRNPAPSRR